MKPPVASKVPITSLMWVMGIKPSSAVGKPSIACCGTRGRVRQAQPGASSLQRAERAAKPSGLLPPLPRKGRDQKSDPPPATGQMSPPFSSGAAVGGRYRQDG